MMTGCPHFSFVSVKLNFTPAHQNVSKKSTLILLKSVAIRFNFLRIQNQSTGADPGGGRCHGGQMTPLQPENDGKLQKN